MATRSTHSTLVWTGGWIRRVTVPQPMEGKPRGDINERAPRMVMGVIGAPVLEATYRQAHTNTHTHKEVTNNTVRGA